jgi:hypothetical protein
MKITMKNKEMFGVQKVVIEQSGYIYIDEHKNSTTPMIIESETVVGFMALSELAKGFEHMKCWSEDGNGEDCEKCPVKFAGTCGIIGIKNAAIAEGIVKGTIHTIEGEKA